MEYQQIEIDGYKVSVDPDFMDDKHKLTPEIKDILGTIFPEIEKGKDSTIKRLRRLCRKYPDVPQLPLPYEVPIFRDAGCRRGYCRSLTHPHKVFHYDKVEATLNVASSTEVVTHCTSYAP